MRKAQNGPLVHLWASGTSETPAFAEASAQASLLQPSLIETSIISVAMIAISEGKKKELSYSEEQ